MPKSATMLPELLTCPPSNVTEPPRPAVMVPWLTTAPGFETDENRYRPLLASKAFASPCGSMLVPLGYFDLKGFPNPEQIYGLPD